MYITPQRCSAYERIKITIIVVVLAIIIIIIIIIINIIFMLATFARRVLMLSFFALIIRV